MTPSDDSETHAAQPLLSNFDDISDFDSPKESGHQSHVSFWALEDGGASDSGSEFGDLRRQHGFWRRLRMALRRRNGRTRSVKLGGEEEKRKTFRWRRRTCLALPVLMVGVL